MEFLIFFLVFLSLTEVSWLRYWACLEFSRFLLIIIILIREREDGFNEGLIKYFIVQVVSGHIFLWSIFLFSFHASLLFILSIMTKLGVCPVHRWFPFVCEFFSWKIFFYLRGVVKFIPLRLLFFQEWERQSVYILISFIIGRLAGVNQVRFRKLFCYSSIVFVCWIILSLLISGSTALCVYIIYIIILVSLCWFFEVLQVWYFRDVVEISRGFFFLICIFFRIAGFPPRLGFVVKWVVRVGLIDLVRLEVVVGVLSRVLIAFMYLRLGWHFLWGAKVRFVSRNRYRTTVVSVLLRLLQLFGFFFCYEVCL